MLRQDDLDIAVEQGVLTEDQARQLVAIAAARHKARRFAVGREEHFRLIGGFNDFFVAVGVLLLGIGLSYAPIAIMLAGATPGRAIVARTPDPQMMLAFATVSALVYWALAEWLTGRLRLTAPSIVLTVLWVTAAGGAGAAWVKWLGMSGTGGFSLVLPFVAALAAASLHYRRFGLPFTLLPIAVSAFLVTLVLFGWAVDRPNPMFDPVIGNALRWIALVVGLTVFAAAMRYDLSDPERLTRAADCGFWLHLAAAPMIVHPLAAPLIDHPMFGRVTATAQVGTTTIALVVSLTLVLAFVALVIDRRALLVAGLGYLGAAITYAISKAGVAPGISTMATLLFLGVTIIVLGTGWRTLRTVLMAALPDFPLKSRLPPYIGAS